ncbi:MAG: hypothetical protein A2X48_00260 [Lentisphaerae bacterium GWF2_49_21]|nr:MAG: hypothetical protein A2X48_00260 [Lentisphaerae bacterium GWF2_49_21]
MKMIAILFAATTLTTVAKADDKPSAPDKDFHLYLLIGQSNMAGRGKVDAESAKTNPKVLMLTKQLTWELAKDPLHFDKSAAGVGPGLAFGRSMSKANPKIKIGLVPCAVGGTSIKLWTPGAADSATKTHPYDDMLKRVQEARKAGVFKGIIWHQGESDLNSSEKYGEQLTELIARLRKDLDAADIPFVSGEIAIFKPERADVTAKFNNVLHELEGKVDKYSWVSAEKLKDGGDKLHLNAESARELGKRYAEKMLALQKK